MFISLLPTDIANGHWRDLQAFETAVNNLLIPIHPLERFFFPREVVQWMIHTDRAVIGISLLMQWIVWNIPASFSEMKQCRCGKRYSVPLYCRITHGAHARTPAQPWPKHDSIFSTSADHPRSACSYPQHWEAGGKRPISFTAVTMDMAQHLFVGQHWAGPWGLSAFWKRLINHLMMDIPICIKQGEIFILFLLVYFNF